MKATAVNTFGVCDRCGLRRPFVIASGFNPDASFRMLCSPCDRIERPHNQLRLFKGAPVHAWTEPEPEPAPDLEPETPRAQMSLF